MNILRYVLIVSFLFSVDLSMAEPWLANKMAQNCAGCHAPGRLNRKPAKRRCTLSCQGCHVNPNGGGLRNNYGKWTEERWLRSFYTDLAWNKPSPAPLKKQKYYPKNLADVEKFHKKKAKGKKGKKKNKSKRKPQSLSNKEKLEYAKHGAGLVGYKGVVLDEAPYFESSNYSAAKNEVDELSRITKNDPYRLERRNMITAGGDLRFFYIQRSEGNSGGPLEEGTFFPMVFDYGVRIRPIKEKLSFVYEGRVLNTAGFAPGADPSSLDKLFGGSGGAINRSAYVLVDDLWYNSYAQIGFYRPMFGLYNSNHTSMINDYTDLNFRTTLKQAGVGVGYNVLFGMANYLLPTEGQTAGIMTEGGFNLTAGMRFVSFGAHATAHYWSSEENLGLAPLKRSMWNINFGGVLVNRRLILNGEITNVRKEKSGQVDEIKVLAADAKFRFWRQMYLQASFAQANAAVNSAELTGLGEGSGNEMTVGVRSFILSGLETEILMSDKVNDSDTIGEQKESTLLFQMHAYF